MRESTVRPPPVAWVVALALVVALAGCGRPADADGEAGGPPQMPPAPVTTVTATPRTLPVTFMHTGMTAPSREVEIRARVTGIIERRLFTEGAVIEVGSPLVELDEAPFKAAVALAEAQLAQARAQLTQDERRAKRILALLDDRVVSREDADNARSAVELSAAAVKAAQARLDSARLELSYTVVRAPLTGRIGRALKTEGALVAAGGDSLVAMMAQLDPLYVEFSVPENDQLARGAAAGQGTLALPDGGYAITVELADGSRVAQPGRIVFTDYRVDPRTGGFGMRAEIANPGGKLLPGQFVRVHLGGAVRPDAIAVPQRAVLDGPAGKFVYAVGTGQDGRPHAEPRPVTVGPWVELDGDGPDARGWIIEKGLAAGTQVIVEGAAKLRPMQAVAPAAGSGSQAAPEAPKAPAASGAAH